MNCLLFRLLVVCSMFLVFILIVLKYASISMASMNCRLSSSFDAIPANAVCISIYAILSSVSIFFTLDLTVSFDMPI